MATSATMITEHSNSKRFRKSHLKSRGGCITCKTRRKKCDESRPVCKNCVTTGRKCGGYSIQSYPLQRASQFQREANSAENSLHLDKPPSLWLLESDQDCLYFGYFIRNTIPQLSSYYDSTFWRSILMPHCFSYPVVKQAAIALGAIHRYHSFISRNSLPGNREYAIEAYIRAIKLFHKTLDSPNPLQVAIIASTLFAAFETFQDDREAAVIHLSHGLKTAFSDRSQQTLLNPASKSPSLTEESLQALIRDINRGLQDLFKHRPNMTGSTIPWNFATLDQAYDHLFTLWESLSRVMLMNRGHIDYEHHADNLTQWRASFTKNSTEAGEAMSKTEQQQQRLLKLFHEAISLLVLTRANRCGDVEKRSGMTRKMRYANLNAHFLKLAMLVEALREDPDSLTHLSTGRLHNFSLDCGLLDSSHCSMPNPFTESLKIYDVAEKLTAMEGDVALACDLVPAHAMWVDVTTSLEDRQIALRYCACETDDSLIWTQKTIKI